MLPVVLGHEVVGHVDSLGKGVTRFHEGQHHQAWDGFTRPTAKSTKTLASLSFRATGRDVNGGYAEYMTVPENYAYPIPSNFSDAEAAPLLCAGAVGYRALKLTDLEDCQQLGLIGFGGSALVVLQVVRRLFPNSSIFVFARNQIARNFALHLGTRGPVISPIVPLRSESRDHRYDAGLETDR